jgi:peptide/nickel transport system ATP-binding protein
MTAAAGLPGAGPDRAAPGLVRPDLGPIPPDRGPVLPDPGPVPPDPDPVRADAGRGNPATRPGGGLEVTGLRVETLAGLPVVDEVSFALPAGGALGLVGESGSGKTTVALALLGYARAGLRIAGGSVRIGGADLLRLPERELRAVRGAKVSYVPQNAGQALDPSMRIGAQVADVLAVHRPGGVSGAAVADALDRVSLPSDRLFRRRYVHQLSGGQQQRLALAMAFACHSEVVVLDEPTTGLDVVTQARILAEIVRLGQETGTTVVFVSHDLAAVAAVAGRVAVMYGGRVVEEGPAGQVITAPVHPYTAGLVSSVPRHTRRDRLLGIPGTAVGVADRPAGCPFAPRCALQTATCAADMPPVTPAVPGHLVRCWHSAQTPRIIRPARTAGPAAAGGAALLAVSSLTVTYGRRPRAVTAVRDVSFAIRPAECLALVGESGSGKSTIARALIGLRPPTSGEIVFDGAALPGRARDRSREARRRIQIVFQDPHDSLNPSMTVADTVMRPLVLFGQQSRAGRRPELMALLERVRLPARLAERYPAELSGGERQRVAIARALAARPDLLLCDEVTSALDVSVQAAVLDLLGSLQRELGLAVLFITHDLGVVASVADRVLVLEGGCVREEGPAGDVLARPAASYTRQLIEAVPELPVAEAPAGT